MIAGASPSPYRPHDDSRRGITYRIRYWPRFTIWPLLLMLIVATPLAWSLRRESRTPSTISCSTAPNTEFASACTVRDGRKIGQPEGVSCDATVPALDTFLDSGNPFARPHVTATVLTTPELPNAVFAPSSNVFINGAPAMTVTKEALPLRNARSKPLVMPMSADRSGGLSATDARVLLASCAAQAGASGEIRHVTLAVFERDFLLSSVTFGALLLLTLAWMAGRRVVVASDGGTGLVEVIERGYFGVRHRAALSASEVERAVVSAGSSGPFHATRIDIRRRNGESVAVTSDFTPMARSADTRLVSRLNLLFASATW
jgi:hypothetical protein